LIIINADDFGLSRQHTDITLECFQNGRISSATCMVFMADSHRAINLAIKSGLDLGLHLNFDLPFNGANVTSEVLKKQEKIRRYLKSSKYASTIYNLGLKDEFKSVFQAQLCEFRKLFGKEPSHIDGHHHLHLCANIIWINLLPKGIPVRRNFTFKKTQKSLFNRLYRKIIDIKIMRRHIVTDYFYSLTDILKNNLIAEINALSKREKVEVMTHPIEKMEYQFLMGQEFGKIVDGTDCTTYNKINSKILK